MDEVLVQKFHIPSKYFSKNSFCVVSTQSCLIYGFLVPLLVKSKAIYNEFVLKLDMFSNLAFECNTIAINKQTRF